MKRILDSIERPEQIQNLSEYQLKQLADELRDFIVENVSKTGGHLAPSLGTVELTLALYHIFDLAQDKVVWDVGHQAYAHKILSGRREQFHLLRQRGGLTGFPKRSESDYDSFGTGHASTSISAALGMAIARDLSGRTEKVIAVIGDGALTGGEAFEALNNAGDMGRNLIVILNDNEMAIDRNVGALAGYLSRLRVAPEYMQAKKELEGLIKRIPHIGDRVFRAAGHLKDGVRSAIIPGNIFSELGFQYLGPVDGHDLNLLCKVLARVHEMEGPVLVHVLTKKGKGYLPAELQPDKFHGVGKFDVDTGELLKKKTDIPTYTSVFSKTLLELAKNDKDIVAITAAMPAGTGLKAFAEAYPDRYFDVGIAEEHAVTMAAGLAAAGKKPVVALYSTFAQRGYDQIVHDVCLQNLPVVFCLDRAGLVGEDGATHHGVFDYSYLRHIPNMTVMAPKDENELRHMLCTAMQMKSPVAIRYPRGQALGVSCEEYMHPLAVGKGEILAKSGSTAILAVGSMVDIAQKAAILLSGEGISTTVVNMRFVKPLDVKLLCDLAADMECIVTMEENALCGGFGSAVAEALSDNEILLPLLRLGIGDKFIEQGTHDQLLEQCGLLPEQAAERIKTFIEKG